MSIEPGKLDFPLYRWAGPWQNSLTINFVGYDFSGATFRAQFREYRDQVGTPLMDLQNAASSAEGISVSVGKQTIIPDEGDPYQATVSVVKLRINETTVEGVLSPSSVGPANDGVRRLVWDLHIDGGGFGKVRWVQGDAPIYAGVTQ